MIFIVLLYNLLNGNIWNAKAYYRDSFFIAGFALVCIGLLSLVSKEGVFDMFSYQLSKHGRLGKVSYYDYTEFKKGQRSGTKLTCIPYFTVALLSLIISFILYVSFYL